MFRICKSVECTTLGSCYLCLYTIFICASIISKVDGFAYTSLWNNVFIKFLRLQAWLNQYVAILLSATSSAHMCLAKTYNFFWYWCPTSIRHIDTVGSGLHHTERHRRTRECTSQANSSNTWVYILGEVLSMCCQDTYQTVYCKK